MVFLGSFYPERNLSLTQAHINNIVTSLLERLRTTLLEEGAACMALPGVNSLGLENSNPPSINITYVLTSSAIKQGW